MRYLTVKRNKNGEPNKTDMKSLAKFFTNENARKYVDYDSHLFAIEETRKAGKEFVGYTFKIATKAEKSGGCDYYFGEVLDTGDKVVISTENEYKSLDWAYNKALEIIKKEF